MSSIQQPESTAVVGAHGTVRTVLAQPAMHG
eukprot:COSAG01_NODE_17744_length_1127_cov_1.277237_4_plen_30_part_01